MILQITKYCQDNISELDFKKGLKVKVVRTIDRYLINLDGHCKLDLKFLNDLDEFVNQFNLYVDKIYNQAQLSLDEDYFSKIEQRTTITLNRCNE